MAEEGICFVFPGQGAQSVGMGKELYYSSKAAKRVFEEADDSLGFSLSKIIFEGPSGMLQDTLNAQPAIIAMSIACWRAWEEFWGQDAPEPLAVAGHSLGEYTALVVAGAIAFRDGIQLVRQRAQLMHAASLERPGAMAAILGLDEAALVHVCAETGVEIANVNTDDQYVISGDKIAVAHAMDLASARGAKKTIPLPVSGAFHSSLMDGAQAGLQSAVQAVKLRKPKVPVIANYSATAIGSPAQIRAGLCSGLCSRVEWNASVRSMVNSGGRFFVEFGPSRVLSSMIKRIDGSVGAVTVSDLNSIRKASEEKKGFFTAMGEHKKEILITVAGLAVGSAVEYGRRRKKRRKEGNGTHGSEESS